MRNHFIISYAGNKRQEVERIEEYLHNKLDGIDTIIESYCGSSAMSCYLSMKYPRRFKYILNDLDPMLIELYHLMKDKVLFDEFMVLLNETVKLIVDKQAYLDAIKPKTVLAWFIKHRIFRIKAGLYPLAYKPKTYNFDDFPILKFLREENVSIRLGNGEDLFIEYENDPTVLCFIDPPYLKSCNCFYTKKTTNIYDYCSDKKMNNFKCKMVFIVEDIPTIRELFPDNIKLSYGKHYEMQHKKTNHVIISNI